MARAGEREREGGGNRLNSQSLALGCLPAAFTRRATRTDFEIVLAVARLIRLSASMLQVGRSITRTFTTSRAWMGQRPEKCVDTEQTNGVRYSLHRFSLFIRALLDRQLVTFYLLAPHHYFHCLSSALALLRTRCRHSASCLLSPYLLYRDLYQLVCYHNTVERKRAHPNHFYSSVCQLFMTYAATLREFKSRPELFPTPSFVSLINNNTMILFL
jgi:hypothetical protein